MMITLKKKNPHLLALMVNFKSKAGKTYVQAKQFIFCVEFSESKQMLSQSSLSSSSVGHSHGHSNPESIGAKMPNNSSQRPYLGQTPLLPSSHSLHSQSQPNTSHHHHQHQHQHGNIQNSSPHNIFVPSSSSSGSGAGAFSMSSIKSEPQPSTGYDNQAFTGGSSSLHHHYPGHNPNSQYQHFSPPLQHGFGANLGGINSPVGEMSGYHHQHNVIQAAKLMASS